MNLKETLEQVQSIAPKKTVYLGSKSGYVFIGNASEVLRNLGELNNRWAYIGLKEDQPYVPLEERIVLNSYSLTTTDGIAIIVEGGEQGPYWDLEEFRKKAV